MAYIYTIARNKNRYFPGINWDCQQHQAVLCLGRQLAVVSNDIDHLSDDNETGGEFHMAVGI